MSRTSYVGTDRALEGIAAHRPLLRDPHPDPDREAKLENASAILDALLARNILTERQLEVFTLTREGYSLREIAVKLGVTHLAVYYRLGWAKKKIKKYLQKSQSNGPKTA